MEYNKINIRFNRIGEIKVYPLPAYVRLKKSEFFQK